MTALLRRHHLPTARWARERLARYLLTNSPHWLGGWDFAVALTGDPGKPAPADELGVGIAVYVDEFVTEADWQQIWKRWVEPRQALLLAQRGRVGAQGRRGADLGRLREVMPVYREMVLHGRSVLAAHSRVARQGVTVPRLDATYRRVHRLGALLDPDAATSDPGAEPIGPST